MSDDELHISDWFPETLSDEAAFALHGFLEQFTWRFEQAYYGQIRRYLDSHAQAIDPPSQDDNEPHTPRGDVDF